jgi:hypothetical protein
MIAPRDCLLLACLALSITGCSAPVPAELKEIAVPKGAVVLPFAVPTKLGAWRGTLKGFWLEDGLADAPALKLKVIGDNGRYRDGPLDTVLELRCEPFARGMILGAGLIRLGMAPPQVAPSDRMVLKAGSITVEGPVHPRTYGWTDTSIPGTLIPADSIDLGQLAKAKTLTVQWGEREASVPAPPDEMFSAFASKCGDAFRFAQWSK